MGYLWNMPGPTVAVLLAAALGVGLAGCSHSRPARNLDLDRIRISPDARLRTDTVGDGAFASRASFVLVDAENTATEGAYVTLGGELTDAAGAPIGELRSQSLWIPPREARTFALVDTERLARPAAGAAQIKVRGAMVPDEPPRAHIADLHSFDDHGKIVVQAYLVNAADRPGQIMAIAAFHDAHGQPMTRPFQLYEVPARDRLVVQFVGPVGASRGTIFVGDTVY